MYITGFLIGATLTASSAITLSQITPNATLRRQVGKFLKRCQCNIMEHVIIKSVKQEGYMQRMEVLLPYGMSLEKFKTHLDALELATGKHIIFRHLYGRICELRFGTAPFYESMDYQEWSDEDDKGKLTIPIYTPYGIHKFDFNDESTCHLLTGGATRMGKTALLRLITTHLMRTTEGNIRFLLIDNKITDLYMFKNIPQITIAETVGEANMYVDDIVKLIEARKQRLNEKEDVVDLKEFREKYPNEPMEPVFVIIDEYGRFSEDEDFQEKIIYIAETAGYLDIHLVISAQRPDASTVLKPRIRANILARISFTTADETNSKMILGTPDAAKLGGIKGRAILLDGFQEKIQVPYIPSDQAVKLLKPYYKKDSGEYDTKRQVDTKTAEAFPSFVKGSVRDVGMS